MRRGNSESTASCASANRALIGATALDILLAEADDPTREAVQVVFQPELVVRQSTRAGGARRGQDQ